MLTRELSAVAQKVVAVELDTRLLPVLKETLADCRNVTVYNGDILKIDVHALLKKEFSGMDVDGVQPTCRIISPLQLS